ncbi:MAG: 4Fe-4S dicluster domain-containing protein [Candidatus Aminicenantes bacterium]|nr:MAG: 4Fe-4S dicluster domain-containing protein [Candidatus Aminicenantes bacterium]
MMRKDKPDHNSSHGRRTFMKNCILGAFSASLASTKLLSGNEKQSHRVKKGQMYYRRLGRTDLQISEISVGGSPVPEMPILHQAYERGVNYIDTSHTYQNGNSERQIGQLLKEVGRDKVHVGTKFHLRRNWSEETIISSVEGSLGRLDTDYMDVLLIHGASNPEHLDDERVLNAFEKLKKQGKYRFNGLSCHSNHHEVVKKAVECGYYDMIQLGYNVFDIQESEKEIQTYEDYLGAGGIRRLIALAKSNDVGIIAMKTLKVGGKRQNLDKYKTGTTSIYQAMLKWALENRDISSVVTEMLTFDQLEEDLGVIGKPLTEGERKNLFRHVVENSKDYCHMCGLCRKSCPSRIETPSILRFLAYHEGYGKIGLAKEAYSRLKPAQTASACKNCGECENACPYGVPVRNKIREAHFLLG